MTQVLLNLLDNAWKYGRPDDAGLPSTSSRAVAIGVCVRTVQRRGRWGQRLTFAAIAVRDRGMGMSRAETRRLFRRYYRTRTAAQRNIVVEDDDAIMLGLEENLKFSGYEVLTASTGPDGLKAAHDGRPDLILLDLMLPGMSGFEVCRELRDRGVQTPVIMLTARQDDFDKIHGFEMGADDYVTKPFSVAELMARINAVLQRGRRRDAGGGEFAFGDCQLDGVARTLRRKGRDVALTRTEFELLSYFCAHEGKALSRETLMNDVWGTEYYGTQRSLDSFVANLRVKIEEKPSKPRHILTVHGVGYKFVR